jgi:O-acetyl-ADP-ribose deacetylase (regulator of RNase III)/transcriptional regulator with XRE-family HTH domain
MPIAIIHEDITCLEVGAIVNAANHSLAMGGGVCGAIFAAAGPQELQRECQAIGHCPTGGAVITKGYKLPSANIIHTVGPVWYGGQQGEPEALTASYQNSLTLAQERGLTSIAFPLISSGIFGYPKDLALHQAIMAIGAYLLKSEEMAVFLTIFGQEVFGLPLDLRLSVKAYLRRYLSQDDKFPPASKGPQKSAADILACFMAAKGLSLDEAAKRANLTKAALRSILEGVPARPAKNILLSLALGLSLTINETQILAESVGERLSALSERDLIVSYFLERAEGNAYLAYEALFAFGQELL